MISRRQIIESHQELNECELYGESDESRRSTLDDGDEVSEEEEEFATKERCPRQPLTPVAGTQISPIKRSNKPNKSRELVAEMQQKQQVISRGPSSSASHKPLTKSKLNDEPTMMRNYQDYHYDTSGKLKLTRRHVDNDDQEQDIDEEEEESSGLGSGGQTACFQDETILLHDNNNLQQQQQQQQEQDYRHFDPYSVYGEEDEEEDVWYSEERLFEDHLQEIVDKWMAIDDEIWAKIICMERNRRIAKAYARKHSLTVNGSEDKYLDGTTLGLNSFDNPDRDAKTRRVKQNIGHGLRISITQSGDIIVKRLSKADVFVHQLHGANSQTSYLADQQLRGSNSSSDVYALNSESGGDCYGVVGRLTALGARPAAANHLTTTSDKTVSSASTSSNSSGWPSASSRAASGGQKRSATKQHLSQSNSNLVPSNFSSSSALELNRPMKIFDMNEFKLLLERESRRPTPNRRFIQSQCISVISFVADDRKMLNLPSWIMIINIVAIDLLKTELGLMDPHDLLGPLAEPPVVEAPSGFCDGDTETLEIVGSPAGDEELYEHKTARAPGKAQRSLAASKKAFANAAASGAYTGNHDNWAYGVHRPRLNNNLPAKKKKEPIKAGSDSQLNKDGLVQAKKKQAQQDKAKEKGQQQQSSSSSGFNSHCSSSQNDSSAASSSSNIAGAASGENEKPVYRGVANLVGVFRKKAATPGAKEPVKRKATKSPAAIASDTPSSHLAKESSELGPRGKRPPKLPHRVTPTTGSVDKLSTAPQANLILVEPTGLSPQLPKRKGQLGGSQLALNAIGGDTDAGVPEFSTIKHIDENGKCSVLTPARLPNGIPAHAQLAPPDTQRQVLRYLMSARNNFAEMTSSPKSRPPPPPSVLPATQQATTPRRPAAPTRYQRPLPILPSQKQRPAGAYQGREPGCDESLYYYGLQARVPTQRRQVHVPAAPPHPVITKSAINAILTDFKLNSQRQLKSNRQQVHYVNPYLRPQFSLNNLHQQYHQSPLHKCDTYCGAGGESCAGDDNNIYDLTKQSLKTSSSGAGPVLNFFRSRGSTNKQQVMQEHRAMFSSVDNLHQRSQQKSSTSLLGGFSGQGFLSKLKGSSKEKKSGSKPDCAN